MPYEVNGFQSVPSVNENTYLATRISNALNGISGPTAVPLVSYSLGGAANNKPGYYNPDHKDFGPRIALAYNPSARDGVLGSIFGERKTTIRLGGAVLYDRIAGGASFGLDQNTFPVRFFCHNLFGVPNYPVSALTSDPRFAGYNSIPPGRLFTGAAECCSAGHPQCGFDGNPSAPLYTGGFHPSYSLTGTRNRRMPSC